MNKKLGFTLIELLSVVLILGILTAIALPQYRKSIQRAETANALINLKTIFDSAKRFKSTSSHWPTSFNGLDIKLLDIAEDGSMGEFLYGFAVDENDGEYAFACRQTPNSGSYCLNAYYRKDGVRDVYTCVYGDQKYQSLCDSLCRTPASGVGEKCVIE